MAVRHYDLPEGDAGPVEIAFDADTTFSGHDTGSDQHFSGRCSGGVSVAAYEATRADYFQYAITDARDTTPERMRTP